MFIGRNAELRLLSSAFKADSSAFSPVYGRRRVVKSELLLRFLTKHRGLYYPGKSTSATLQLREFLRESARVCQEPLLASMNTTSWKEALKAVVERWPGKGKLVLVLDEFQWMAEASPELPSVLQELWDRHWKSSNKVMLILCGSFIGFMKREVLGKRSPLFGRRTAQILLRPFGYQEAAKFHPRWSLEDRARAYFLCGGIPMYLQFFEERRSIEQNIEHALLGEFSPLFREPEFLLREELRDTVSYSAVLLAIAEGHHTNRQIAGRSGLPERSFHYYIQQLIELGYLSRKYPATGKPPSRRSVRYILDDPLLRFWFRFVFPNLSFIQQMGGKRALKDRIQPELPGYFGSCFERLCREALPVIYDREGVSSSFEIGEYWDKTTQIDVVGVRDDNWTDLGECKWGTVKSIAALRAELAAKTHPNSRGATLARRYFLRKKPPRIKPQSNEWWCGLKDLY